MAVVEREVGQAPTAAHPRAGRLVSEAERHIVRGRQIVARQRDLVAKIGEQDAPRAVALWRTFERSLTIIEEILAAHQRNEVPTATTEQALRSSKALLVPIPNCLEPADATGPKLVHQVKSAAAHIMKILREGGYDCERTRSTDVSEQRIASSLFSRQN